MNVRMRTWIPARHWTSPLWRTCAGMTAFFIHALSPLALHAVEPEQISVKHGTHTFKPGDSVRPSISDDGRIVAFESGARLLMEDRNKIKDIYIYDRSENNLIRIKTVDQKRKNGGPSVSSDGCAVAFHSYLPDEKKQEIPHRSEIGVYELGSADIDWPMADFYQGILNGESLNPVFGRNNESILFTSNSSTLLSKDGFSQIYFIERRGLKPILLSKNAQGEPANRPCGNPRMSRDGKQVAFLSAATNFDPLLPVDNGTFHLYWLDRTVGTLVRVDLFEKGFDPKEWMVGSFDMDASGTYLIFEARHRDLVDPYKTLSSCDLFGYDREKDRVALLTSGIFSNKARNPSLSANGRYLVFILMEGGGVVVHDRKTDRWKRAADGPCDNPKISGDGSTIVFEKLEKKNRNVFIVPNPLFNN